MADEGTVTTDVTDDDLEAAFKELKGEEVKEEAAEASETVLTEEEQAEAEVTKDMSAEELEAHKEKSKLGRKFKTLEQKYTDLEARFNSLKGNGVKDEPTYQAPQEDEAELDEIRELYQTDPITAKRRQDAYDKRIYANESKSYESAFLKQVNELSTEDPDLHEEVFRELLEHHNVRLSNDPIADADRNYGRAKVAVLKRMSSGEVKRPATAGGKSGVPVKPASTTREAAKTVTLPDLSKDPATSDYVAYLKRQGVSDEEIAKSL